MPRNIYSYRDNKYEFEQFSDDRFDFNICKINGDTYKPTFLYKYYQLSNNSISALINSYLFAPHPLQLNDKYDCSEQLVNISDHTINDYLNSYLSNYYSKDQIIDSFNNHREELDNFYLSLEQRRLFYQFGIISLCENYNDILMWAYYAQNNGFLIKFQTDLLPSEFIGPFPVNYVPELAKINSAEHGSMISFLYQTNVKSILWKREQEWRFIVRNPKGKYHPFHNKQDISSRLYLYNKKSVQEIHLGYDFILPTEVISNSENEEYVRFKTNSQNHKLKRKLLTYIYDNKIPCFRMLKYNLAYKLGMQKVDIQKISSHRYIFKLGDIYV